MKTHHVKVKSISPVTHDVLQIVTEKPPHYAYTPGQGTTISINKNNSRYKVRPFTFTSLPDDDYLEFIIKTYPQRDGVTDELHDLKIGDEMILHDVIGTITYKGEGVFIAGGAGITPFISIFRYLEAQNKIGNNKLIFANKTKSDIILEQYFNDILGDNFLNILSDEKANGYAYGLITMDFLKDNIADFNQQFYVCGPPPMMKQVLMHLSNLGVDNDSITIEKI